MTGHLAATDRPGFTDPVAEAQACFRAMLAAMARPGRIMQAGNTLQPPPSLHPATAAAVLTLVDAETPLWLDDAMQDAGSWIAFHCGAPAAPLEQARFVVAEHLPDLALIDAGTDEAPEDGATVILQVTALGQGRGFILDGPGLQGPETLRVDGLPHGFGEMWRSNHACFPRGIDLVLCAGDWLAALPRSVRVTEE